MAKLTWLSHASWLIETGEHRILLDPFLTDNPTATTGPKDYGDVSHILISHGHFDHVADAAEIANESGATIVAIFEIAKWFTEVHQVKSTIAMNIGGNVELPFGNLQMVPAWHSSQMPDGSYGGSPAGFVLTIDEHRIYFACDTALFKGMRLYAHQPDVAVLPIGDRFTMGIQDSIRAINLIEPITVMPTHYNTWPEIEVDAEIWERRVREETQAMPVVLPVGGSFEL